MGERSWDVSFTWDLNDWDLDLVLDFLCILESNTHSTKNEDCMKWKLKKNGNLTSVRFIINPKVLFPSSFLGMYLES